MVDTTGGQTFAEQRTFRRTYWRTSTNDVDRLLVTRSLSAPRLSKRHNLDPVVSRASPQDCHYLMEGKDRNFAVSN